MARNFGLRRKLDERPPVVAWWRRFMGAVDVIRNVIARVA